MKKFFYEIAFQYDYICDWTMNQNGNGLDDEKESKEWLKKLDNDINALYQAHMKRMIIEETETMELIISYH